jgi:hypothetical protein
MKFFARISVNVEPLQNLYVSNKFVKKFNNTAIKLLTDNQNYKAIQYEVTFSALRETPCYLLSYKNYSILTRIFL